MGTYLEEELKQFVEDDTKIRGTVPVAEVFPAYQGEGMLIGQPTIFLRLGGCNDRCVWCDSKYAVLPKYSKHWVRMQPEDVLRAVEAAHNRVRHVTLTGGNPAMHKAFAPHLDQLQAAGYSVAIETQGNIYPEWGKQLDQVTLSPKPPSSGNPTDVHCEAFRQWITAHQSHVFDLEMEDEKVLRVAEERVIFQNICLKIVIFDRDDYQYMREVHAAYPDLPLFLQTGTEQGLPDPTEMIVRSTIWLEQTVAMDKKLDQSKIRVLPQLHVILHGTKRGV